MLTGERTRANHTHVIPEPFRVHRNSQELRFVSDTELADLGRVYARLTVNGRALWRAMLRISFEDRGVDEFNDRGFVVRSFTRDNLARAHRPSAPAGPRLYRIDDAVLRQLEAAKFLTIWRELLRQAEYVTPDGRVLRYKAAWQYRLMLTPSAAVWSLMQTKAARSRVEKMLTYR